jgi:probable rRNA maturation factor
MIALNKKFLGRAYATDVLAFDLTDDIKQDKNPKEISGEVIISTDAVKKNTKEFQTSYAHELALYIIHGILHLLGYDDHKPADIKKMRNKEQELLGVLGKKIENLV